MARVAPLVFLRCGGPSQVSTRRLHNTSRLLRGRDQLQLPVLCTLQYAKFYTLRIAHYRHACCISLLLASLCWINPFRRSRLVHSNYYKQRLRGCAHYMQRTAFQFGSIDEAARSASVVWIVFQDMSRLNRFNHLAKGNLLLHHLLMSVDRHAEITTNRLIANFLESWLNILRIQAAHLRYSTLGNLRDQVRLMNANSKPFSEDTQRRTKKGETI